MGEEKTPDIHVRELEKRYGGQPVLRGVNLDVHHGEVMAIMGGSGSGKSTLLRHLIGAEVPDAGTVELLGRQWADLSETERDEQRKNIGVLFQSGALFNSMTLRQNVALILQEHTELPPETVDIMVTIKLELVGLREHGDKYPAQISGGMKKRAGLARALALDPKVLFYDEPSAGLDPVTTAEVDQLILSLSRQLGVTSVVVTHVMESALRIADRMTMLDQGVMLRTGPHSEFEELIRADPARVSEEDRLIRQFMKGEAEGPLTARGAQSGYVEHLLGEDAAAGISPRPSVQSTR